MNAFFKLKIMTAICLFVLTAQAQNAHKYLRKGDSAYKNGSYSDAEVNYRRALEKKNTTQGEYNLGNSTYRQERYDEAIKHYESVAETAKDRQTKARAYHNLGNSYFQKDKIQESIEAYKNALRLNPNDIDTKRNLANALRRLPPPQPQNQQSQGNDNKDQQQQKDKNEQENQPNQGQQPQDKQEGENQDEQNEEQSSGSQGQPEDLSKEEARQLLEIMDGEEQKVQQKLRKAQSGNKKLKKDW
jgi:Ca-activated chloride channel homolog